MLKRPYYGTYIHSNIDSCVCTYIYSVCNMCTREPFISVLLDKYVLSPNSFASALATILSHQFHGDIPQQAWQAEFEHATVSKYESDRVDIMCAADLTSILNRDPACEGLVHAFVNFKGFKALVSHRIAHVFWQAGRRDVALAIQSRASELYGVDIHPAARIGSGKKILLSSACFYPFFNCLYVGLMIDHATGLVIGETCVIGNNCSFLHGVTLGSSGKEKGHRHPQIGNDVLIGCNASVLGYIHIGDKCKIGSGSIVLKSVCAGATAVGNPARIIDREVKLTNAQQDEKTEQIIASTTHASITNNPSQSRRFQCILLTCRRFPVLSSLVDLIGIRAFFAFSIVCSILAASSTFVDEQFGSSNVE